MKAMSNEFGSPFEVEVIRSPRRRSTISGRLEGDTLVVRIPATLTAEEERQAVDQLVKKAMRKHETPARSDADLVKRAQHLNGMYLDNRATVGSIRWVNNQTTRWGSCTPNTAEIRISSRLKHVPGYVLDAVLIHELVHTFIANHSQEFYAWADKAPRAERARGYLEAYQRWGRNGS